MSLDNIFFQLCASLLFLTVILLHITKKNISEVLLYGLQSTAVVVLMGLSVFKSSSLSLVAVLIIMLTVKVVLTPIFFARIINQYKLKFTDSRYLSTPITLFVIALILLLVGSDVFRPLTEIAPDYKAYLTLVLAAMLMSVFLIINRKGVVSQAMGVLSLENSIVMFAIFAGLEQSPLFQLGIIFDIFIWILLAVVFVSMIFRHFGTLDATNMKNLKG
ncbi:MAG: hypothetical protein WCH58_03805 [Candidatus Saccharibacteria bacterium]